MMVSTLWIKLYSEYECEIRYHRGKANVATVALSRKERVKPRRVRAMAMIIQYGAYRKSLVTAIRFEYYLGILERMDKVKVAVLWAEIGESSLIGPELVQETTDKVVLIKEHESPLLSFVWTLSTHLTITLWAVLDTLGANPFLSHLHVPLDKTKVDKNSCFVGEPVEE
ncbi:hypothetical protein Tco_1276075 [Tanacetum coccineum]